MTEADHYERVAETLNQLYIEAAGTHPFVAKMQPVNPVDLVAHVLREARREFDMDAALDRALRAYYGRDWPHKWPVASEENERERMRRTIQAALDEGEGG